MTRVSELIKGARAKQHLSQAKVARYCGLMSPQYLSNAELGKCVVSVNIAQKLCEILRIKNVTMRNAIVRDFSDKLKRKWK